MTLQNTSYYRQAIRKSNTFSTKTGSFSGNCVYDHCPHCHEITYQYKVLSYRTAIYQHCQECDHKSYNATKYSVTTSNHQTQVQMAIDEPYTTVTDIKRGTSNIF